MDINAIKVKQPFGEFYLAKFKAKDLLKLTTSSVLRYNEEGKLVGSQRGISETRLKEIANFINSDDMIFPTSVLLAANASISGLLDADDRRRWTVMQKDDSDMYIIHIPDEAFVKDIKDVKQYTSLIIDGQHRLFAFTKAQEERQEEIELVCSIFFDIPNPYQAYLFATINGNQRKVDKSLALELYGFNLEEEDKDTWAPEKLAVFLCRALNLDTKSPFHKKIKLSPMYSAIELTVDKKEWAYSTAAIVNGILKLISLNPQYDRDFLAMGKNKLFGKKTRSSLKGVEGKLHNSKEAVLRKEYVNCEDKLIYQIILKYFKSVEQIIWDVHEETNVIQKTIGVTVLFSILKEILEHRKDKISDITDIHFEEELEKLKDIKYEDNYFQFSGKGTSRLLRVMRYKLGYIDEDKLKENDRDYIGV